MPLDKAHSFDNSTSAQYKNEKEERIKIDSSILPQKADNEIEPLEKRLEIIKESNNEMSNSSILVSGRNPAKATKTARSSKSNVEIEDKKNLSMHNHQRSIDAYKKEEHRVIEKRTIQKHLSKIDIAFIPKHNLDSSLSAKIDHTIFNHMSSNEKDKGKRPIKANNRCLYPPLPYAVFLNTVLADV